MGPFYKWLWYVVVIVGNVDFHVGFTTFESKYQTLKATQQKIPNHILCLKMYA